MPLPILAIAGITVVLALLFGQKKLITSAYGTAKAALFRIPNSIFALIENACDEPWSVFVRTVREPGENLVIAVLAFGMDDVVRGAVRPKNLRGKAHIRRGGKSGRKGGGIPEIGEVVGKNIPGADTVKGRGITMAEGMLWQADNVIQRGAWYWFVIQLADDFTYEWASAIVDSKQCQSIADGRWMAQLDHDIRLNYLDHNFNFPQTYSSVTYDPNTSEVILNGYPGWTLLTVNGRHEQGAATDFKIEIICSVGAIVVASVEKTIGVDIGEAFSVNVGLTIPQGTLRIQYRYTLTKKPGPNQSVICYEGSQLWGQVSGGF